MTRTGAAADHVGYFHEAVYYQADEELLAIVLPFLVGGVDEKEPTVVAFGPEKADLVRRALPPSAASGVTFLTGGSMYARPAAAIRAYQDLLAGHVADGAMQIRIVGEIPRPSLGATWDWWARYESAINHAYDDYPLWSLCAYDTRITPSAVLDDVARTHPRSLQADGRHEPSPTYVAPSAFLSAWPPAAPDPLQAGPPRVTLVDPTAAQARHAVRLVDPGLPVDDIEELVVAVSEVVTNALRHGLPPVRVRYWSGADRIVVAVTDGGTGPEDPFAGLLPSRENATGGLGLWITHQSCNYVTFARDADGFTLRLTAGNPY
ncbi:sensor histidine kinase [Asanoa sp. WMMD1127]|uniref:sensor histidine kinase n=1 Tax=Asanoa sp. WMMD1127 TaxID=3016107 RepID=UPI0024176F7D|nr:sensor histidine kinase [Asanoa sp. WMMD1127]MDG4826253.1 sensor histidine kinase [Asanoa sp. WMMD1127]